MAVSEARRAAFLWDLEQVEAWERNEAVAERTLQVGRDGLTQAERARRQRRGAFMCMGSIPVLGSLPGLTLFLPAWALALVALAGLTGLLGGWALAHRDRTELTQASVAALFIYDKLVEGLERARREGSIGRAQARETLRHAHGALLMGYAHSRSSLISHLSLLAEPWAGSEPLPEPTGPVRQGPILDSYPNSHRVWRGQRALGLREYRAGAWATFSPCCGRIAAGMVKGKGLACVHCRQPVRLPVGEVAMDEAAMEALVADFLDLDPLTAAMVVASARAFA